MTCNLILPLLERCMRDLCTYYSCTELVRCDKQQKLFLYIDATSSNTFENFCPVMVVLQMLVAAFNPSATSGIHIDALLFSDNARGRGPSPIFNMSTSCFNAVQGQNNSLLSLLIDFGVCLDRGRVYDSAQFPSLCGEGTSAVRGLREIHRRVSSSGNSIENSVLMVTDGIILDDATERTRVLNDLRSAGVSPLIAAGINSGTSTVDSANLRLYTSADNIVVGSSTDPVQFGVDIVNKLVETGVLCLEHGNYFYLNYSA